MPCLDMLRSIFLWSNFPNKHSSIYSNQKNKDKDLLGCPSYGQVITESFQHENALVKLKFRRTGEAHGPIL